MIPSRVAGFEELLREGRLCASRCRGCGYTSMPPRADCPACLSAEWKWVERGGAATLYSFTTIHSAPVGFSAPYVIGVVDLDEGGRLMAPFPRGTADSDVRVGMRVQVVVSEGRYELRAASSDHPI
ncbi:MAG: Zn-ribbon domain-containing OB-fold protein [Deltaproteobacteria bacterium]|nr:Zn-ribbon domain-containing OB-fold protein [Deltaproteobacteria bacterium]